MPNLAELQRWMKQVITDPRGVSDVLQEPSFSLSPVIALISEDACHDKTQRLNIYAEAYFWRIVEAIEADFPVLKKVLDETSSEDAFVKLIADYLKVYPSKSANIGEIGKHLPVFLETGPVSDAPPFLPDLARLEWLMIESFYERDKVPFDPSILANLDEESWPKIRFKLCPSIRFLETKWALTPLWNEEEPITLDQIIRFSAESPGFILLWRPQNQVKVQALNEKQFLILKSMAAGASLGECLFALSETSSAELPVMDWFSEWMALGVFEKIILEEN